ncbi:MAG: glutathione S-transferase family protein [Paenibacillaceae bacterium]|nr:glutathione S-transferase family protein [Paenibacillaceae bacterium]
MRYKEADGLAEGVEIFENTFRHQIQSDGEITIQENFFRDKFGDKEGEWPVEPDRYRLLWMPACPHAHKVVIARRLLGLDRVISLGTTGIYRDPKGWVFTEDPGEKDPVLGIHYLKELYDSDAPGGDYKERPTVPILADTFTGRGVNNDHFWIPVYFETAWKPYHKKSAPELYPADLREEIDQWNHFIFHRINNGVYDIGFARSQAAYETAYHLFFEAMDILDKRLESRRFLLGDYITDSDIRLYPTLARFDVVYHQVFKANKKRLTDYKNLWSYARDLYHVPEIKESTYFDIYKRHYQLSPHLKPLWGNVHSIVAKGPDVSGWELQADREFLSRNPKEKFLLQEEQHV